MQQPTDAQLMRLYELIQSNWQQSGFIYEFGIDPNSVFDGCDLAVFGTSIDNSQWTLTQAYYIYLDGASAVMNGSAQIRFAQGISTNNIIDNHRNPLTLTK